MLSSRLRVRSVLVWAPLTALALASCKHAEKRTDPIVHKLEIEGAKQVRASSIEKRILTTQQSWIPFSRKQYFDPDIWRTDLRRIERIYRSEGFYQARVVSDEVTPVPGKNEVEVKVHVDEGEPTIVRTVEIAGLDDLPEDFRNKVMDKVDLSTGQIFIEDRWEGLKQKIAATLHELGYAAAVAEGEARVDVATQRADVRVNVVHGPRLHFGPIHVIQRDPHRVEEWRIREQAEAELRQKDWYSVHAQGDAQARIFKLGVFGAVKVYPEKPDLQTGQVPMAVEVQEGPFHQLRAGVGVGVDLQRTDLHGTGQYTDRDFLGGLRRLTLTATAGYAWIPSVTTTTANGGRHGPIGSLTANFNQPRFLARDLAVEGELNVEQALWPAYAYTGGRAKLGVVWSPSPWLNIYPSYNIEYYHLESGSVALGGTAPTLLFGCPTNCFLSYLEERVEYDKRDDRQEPKHGYLLGIALQEGGSILGGNFTYVRVLPEARGYASFLQDDRLTLAGRIRFGTLLNGNVSSDPLSSPIVARFYSGGNWMRGFNATRLSPQVVEPLPNDPTTAVLEPVGGNGLIEASVETRYTITGPLVGAVFVDSGTVLAQSLTFGNLGLYARSLYYAFGAGLRYRTPVGPIRVDFAYRPDVGPPLQVFQQPGTTLTYKQQTGCFGIGKGSRAGAPEGPCTVQLSIGEAF